MNITKSLIAAATAVALVAGSISVTSALAVSGMLLGRTPPRSPLFGASVLLASAAEAAKALIRRRVSGRQDQQDECDATVRGWSHA